MNAFQHYIADLERHPMTLAETTSEADKRKVIAMEDREAAVILCLDKTGRPASEIGRMVGATQGHIAHILTRLKDQKRITTEKQPGGKPALWTKVSEHAAFEVSP
jgi:DNA-directed RNA polymerase specialized sigma subunit